MASATDIRPSELLRFHPRGWALSDADLLPYVPRVDDQELGAHEEDDQRLDHRREVRRELGRKICARELSRRRADLQRSEEDRGEEDPDRLVPSEERDGDPDEADGADVVVVDRLVELPPEDVD